MNMQRTGEGNPTVRKITEASVPMGDRRRTRASRRSDGLKRVAVYCRVSTENESQESSFNNQMKFFTDRICREKNWALAGVYADRGISGTSMRNRKEFNRMIQDCEAGKIDTVLTKGISRFARNTVDTLEIVRKLKALGVNVVFDNQNLDTASERSELFLTILAAMAQEVSQSISENVRWSNQKRYQMGEVSWQPTYGYRKDAESGASYLPDGLRADAVRRIFALYLDGYSTLEIMRIMQEEGWPAPNRSNIWYNKAVCNILANEKYRGDALLQKSYVADVLTHRRVRNDQGERTRYYVKGNHQPLVDPLDFDRAQRIRQLRCTHGGCPQYPYADRLACPICGAFLRQTPVAAQGARSAWFCGSCGGFAILTSYLNGAMLSAHRIEIGTARERVAYGWLDVLVGRVEFTCEGIRVVWRSGRRTEVPIVYRYPRERPQHIAQLLRAQHGSQNMEKGREK